MKRTTDWIHHRYWLAGVGLVIAAVYRLLFANAFNLPREDDYDAILSFLNGYVSLDGGWAKLCYFLGSQHNEYKLFFVHGLVIAQHALTGTVNFAVLECLGDLGLLGIFAVLLLHLPGRERPWGQGLLLLPLAFLSLSLRSLETLNWAAPGLQNVSVVAFSLMTIHFITKDSARSGVGACVGVALAIAASGNGLFVLCSGSLAIVERRRYRLLLPWVLTGAVCAGVYAYHYTPVVKHPGAAVVAPHGIGSTLLFPLAFLGNLVAQPALAVVYALVLLAVLVVLLRRGLRQRAPFVFHAVVFVLLTAAGVSVTRHAGGLMAAVPSRYTLYSLLLTSLMYLGVLACLRQGGEAPSQMPLWTGWRPVLLGVFTVGTGLLWAHYMVLGGRLLRTQKAGIQESFSEWEHGTKSDPVYISPLVHSRDLEELGPRAASIAQRAERLHVMTPPLETGAVPVPAH